MTAKDRSRRWGVVWLPLGFTVGVLASSTPAWAQLDDIDTPWIMPFDVNQDARSDPPGLLNQEAVYNFIWQTFIALDWPQKVDGRRAEPDTTQGLAPWDDGADSAGPVVWQTYMRPSDIFIKPQEWPVEWNDAAPQAACDGAEGSDFVVISPNSTNYADNNSDGLNQPFTHATYATGPVTDQNGNYLRYEVGVNEAFFTYIGHYRYYVPLRQKTAVARYLTYVTKHGTAPPESNDRNARHFQPLPGGGEAYLNGLPDYARQGIAEWKVAWKILDGNDKPERFFRQTVYFLNPDGSCTGPVTAGLVGMHVHRVTPSLGHIGATFEQVDNTRLQPAYSAEAVNGASGLPRHASLNPGGVVSPNYMNGYQVCDSYGQNCVEGVGGSLPPLIGDNDPLPAYPQITNVVRQVEIDPQVRAVNAKWRERLKGSVWFYYQLIGAQNKNLDEPNPNLGPGVLGAQVSSTNNLINTTLESYTQKGWSCALCHQNATPLGVGLPLPPFSKEYSALRTISFLLQNARSNRDTGG